MNALEKMIHIALFTPGLNNRWGLPLLFWGEPGVGKSKRIETFALYLQLTMYTLIASIREPSDFGGLPIPVERGKKTFIEYTPPGWAADIEIDGEGRGVVFTDEITTCAPAVQAALLRMILNGSLGDYELPFGVRFIAAANDTQDAAGGWDLSPPLANRFGHVRWDTSDLADGWCDWLTGANQTSKIDDLLEQWDGEGDLPDVKDIAGMGTPSTFDPAEEERRVLREWPEAFAKAKGTVASFINARRDLLHQMPKAGSANRSRAWPSPRTWEMATRALAGCFVHKADENLTNDMIEAFIGHAAAVEFQTFRAKLDLPDPAEVLDGKVKFEHVPTRLDRTVAVMSSCTALVTSKKCDNRDERAKKFWEILAAIDESSTDLVIKPASALVQENLGMTSKHMKPVLVHLRPVLKEAGVKVR
jgi:hypothetical protein